MDEKINIQAQIEEHSRIRYFDALKCLGILLVIEGHVRLYGMGLTTYSSISSIMLYSFNMPLFFFISGYLAYKKSFFLGGGKSDIIRNVKKKAQNLLVPAVMFFLIYSFYTHTSPLEFFSKGFKEYWFTYTLFWCFIVYYIVSLISRSETLVTVWLIVISFIGLIYLSLFSKYDIAILDINKFSKYFQFFAIGVLANHQYSTYKKILSSDIIRSFALVCFISVLLILDYEELQPFVFRISRDIVLRYLATFVVLSLFFNNETFFQKPSKINNLVQYICCSRKSRHEMMEK